MCSRDLKISVSYDALNADNTFSGGDRISGRVTLEVRKEMKIKSFSVRAEGKASVMWTEFYGQIFVVFHDKETCLQLETIFIQKENTGKKRIEVEHSLVNWNSLSMLYFCSCHACCMSMIYSHCKRVSQDRSVSLIPAIFNVRY